MAQAESIDCIDMRLERLCSNWPNSCSALMYRKRGGWVGGLTAHLMVWLKDALRMWLLSLEKLRQVTPLL